MRAKLVEKPTIHLPQEATFLIRQGRCYYLRIAPIPYRYKLEKWKHLLKSGSIKSNQAT